MIYQHLLITIIYYIIIIKITKREKMINCVFKIKKKKKVNAERVVDVFSKTNDEYFRILF